MYPRNFDYGMMQGFGRGDMHIESGGGLGILWIMGWLFTIGYLKLSFGKGLLALIVWPYYLGIHYHGKHNHSQ